MRIILFILWSVCFVVPVCAMTQSNIEDQTSVEITVYNDNLGLVKDRRKVSVETGEGELRFMDVAAYIRPESVHIKEMNRPRKFMILEQNYEYDLISYEKILEKNVGQSIKLSYRNPQTDRITEVNAELLSYNDGQPVYKIDEEIHLGHPGTPIIPKIPENLISKPTLMWLYDNDAGRNLDLEVSYLTDEISWQADYVLVVDKADTAGDLSGWVSIDNHTGATYNDAKLKVVAGDVNRVHQNMYLDQEVRARAAVLTKQAKGFTEEKFFEYHIYDLARPTTIKNNQKKQINLLNADGVRLVKSYEVVGQSFYYFGVYEGASIPKMPVNVFMVFKNDEKNGLGVPLPKGIFRLYKKDTVGSLQFIGEDRIDHTPKNESVKLRVGEAFDIVAERKQISYQVIARNVYDSEWEIEIRNHKEEDVTVNIIEPALSDWEVKESSHKYETIDAFRIKFPINVKADGKATLKYKIRTKH